jgi:hypothetical protein
MTDQKTQIARHRAGMPERFRKRYDLAMSGRSRKAAMQSFCVECCGYEFQEVRRCTSSECPLFPYRPLSRISQGAPQDIPDGAEWKNSVETA